MLGLLSSIIRADTVRVPAMQQRARMGFQVGIPHSENIVEDFGGIPRKGIAKAGHGYCYSLFCALAGSDIRCAEIAKEHVISCIVAMGQRPSIQQAREIAKSRLLSLTSPEKAETISYLVAHDTIGYGPISILMESSQDIEEIEINSPNSWITLCSPRYGRCITNMKFDSEASFRSTINRMAIEMDKELNESTPIIDVQVANMRVHAQIRPYAVSGAAASIRVGGRKEINLEYLIRNGTISPEALAYLWIALECKHNLIVSGAPASGKTTFLSSLAAFVPANEKIITVEEDINEIKAAGPSNVIALYGSRYNSVTPKEQVINSLRLRPSRIIVGEMRGEEAKDLFMGANIGVSFAATMHSNEGGMQVLKKLLVKPMSVESRSLSALDISIYMKQADLSKRVVSDICEYRWLSRAETTEGEDVCGDDLVKVVQVYDISGMKLPELAGSKIIAAYMRAHRITASAAMKEYGRRVKLLSLPLRERGSCDIEKSISEYLGW